MRPEESFERCVIGRNTEAIMKWRYSVGVAWEETEATQNAPLLTDFLTQMPACIAGRRTINLEHHSPHPEANLISAWVSFSLVIPGLDAPRNMKPECLKGYSQVSLPNMLTASFSGTGPWRYLGEHSMLASI